ncbi:putative zinc-binding metallopeptidase [soil metagenome]
MKTFHCICGNRLYFENSLCLVCQRKVGWCPGCNAINAILPEGDGYYTCGDNNCRNKIVKCQNYQVFNVCNRMVLVPPLNHESSGLDLCDYCRFNETIPDLNIPGNIEKWYRLEVAKRRLLYLLDLLRLPYGTRAENFKLPLVFDFKADGILASEHWRDMANAEKVYTGHANGKITINLREADPVEREKLRVSFSESHRTLVGHFRHEIGHYYWQLLVQGQEENAFKEIFGYYEAISYSEALENYYQQGPKNNWQENYISAYASMHPWEDFAETWGAYLDMISVLDTAENADLLQDENEDLKNVQFTTMIERYLSLGLKMNEMNRALGLLDLVPEVFSPNVVNKMRYIHKLITKNQLPKTQKY